MLFQSNPCFSYSDMISYCFNISHVLLLQIWIFLHRYMAPAPPPYDSYGGYHAPPVPMPAHAPAPIPAPSSYVPVQVTFFC